MTNKELVEKVEKLLAEKGVVCICNAEDVEGDYKYKRDGEIMLWLGDMESKDKSLLVALSALHCYLDNHDS